MRPAAASTNRRVSGGDAGHAAAGSSARSAPRSAGAPPSPWTSAIDVARRRSGRRRRAALRRPTAGSSCRNDFERDVEPRDHAGGLGQETPRARCGGRHGRVGGDVAPAESSASARRTTRGSAPGSSGANGTLFIRAVLPRPGRAGEVDLDAERSDTSCSSSSMNPPPAGPVDLGGAQRRRCAATTTTSGTRASRAALAPPTSSSASRPAPRRELQARASAAPRHRRAGADGQQLAASARRAVHRSVLPPGPDFFGHERQERREQPQHRRQRGQQRAIGGLGELGALIAVAAALDQLEVVVAERPEERLRALEYGA